MNEEEVNDVIAILKKKSTDAFNEALEQTPTVQIGDSEFVQKEYFAESMNRIIHVQMMLQVVMIEDGHLIPDRALEILKRSVEVLQGSEEEEAEGEDPESGDVA